MLMKGDIRGVFILGNQKKEKTKTYWWEEFLTLHTLVCLWNITSFANYFHMRMNKLLLPGGGIFCTKKINSHGNFLCSRIFFFTFQISFSASGVISFQFLSWSRVKSPINKLFICCKTRAKNKLEGENHARKTWK